MRAKYNQPAQVTTLALSNLTGVTYLTSESAGVDSDPQNRVGGFDSHRSLRNGDKMEHETAVIVSMFLCGIPALAGSSLTKHKTGSVLLGFIVGGICGAIGLWIATLIFGVTG